MRKKYPLADFIRHCADKHLRWINSEGKYEGSYGYKLYEMSSQFTCETFIYGVDSLHGEVRYCNAVETCTALAESMGLQKPTYNLGAFDDVVKQDRQNVRYAWMEMLALYAEDIEVFYIVDNFSVE